MGKPELRWKYLLPEPRSPLYVSFCMCVCDKMYQCYIFQKSYLKKSSPWFWLSLLKLNDFCGPFMMPGSCILSPGPFIFQDQYIPSSSSSSAHAWPCFLNDLAKGSKQNRTSKIFTPTSAHLCLAHVNLLPISLSRPLLWASIPSFPSTQRHCSCKLLFSPEFSLSSSAMDLFQHHEKYAIIAPFFTNNNNKKLLTLFPLSRYCQFFSPYLWGKTLPKIYFHGLQSLSSPLPLTS